MKRYWVTLMLCAAAFWTRGSYANLINLSPVDDGRIVNNVLGFWYSNTTDSTLVISRSGSIVSFGILEFDFSTLPDAAILTGATLHLTTSTIITNVGNAPATVYVYGFNGDGVVANGDQNASAATLSTDVYPTGTVSVGGYPGNTPLALTFDNVDPLYGAVSGNGFFTLRVLVPSYVTFPVYSSETANPAYRPYLSIDYSLSSNGTIPEPNVLALTAFGLMALAAAKLRPYRRRR